MVAPRNVTVSGRPVASFTFALNYALAPVDARNTFDPPSPGSFISSVNFERNVWGYHALNLAIHLLAALTLFGVVRRTLEMPALRPIAGGAATPLAFLIALAWTVHPLQTGSVTYIVQRVESLMGLFLLITLYCAIRSAEAAGLKSGPTYVGEGATPAKKRVTSATERATPTPIGPNLSSANLLWTVAAVVACALGMGTKEVMVGAPLIVLLWDWTFLPGTFADIARRRWPLYLGLAATWIILGALVAMDARPLSSGFGFADWPWWRYLATQQGVLVHYLKSVLAPDLVLDYGWPAARNVADILLPAAVIVTLGVGTLWQLARRRALGFAGAWFFIILAPSSSILPVVTEIAAEHRMYLPLAAVLAAVIVGATGLVKCWTRKPLAPEFVQWAAFVFIGSCAWAAHARNNYASDLLKTGQPKAAAEHLEVAIAESPDLAEAHANLDVALATQGQYLEALVHFERAVEIDPFYTAVFENMGEAYGTQNQLAKAAKYFQKALDQKPDDVALLNKTAWILATAADPAARDGARAIVLAEHAVDLTRRQDASSLDSLAAALAESGRFDEAITAGSEALALAHARGDQQYPLELQQRLSLYQARKPFRQ